jgi:hypothetical protein
VLADVTGRAPELAEAGPTEALGQLDATYVCHTLRDPRGILLQGLGPQQEIARGWWHRRTEPLPWT